MAGSSARAWLRLPSPPRVAPAAVLFLSDGPEIATTRCVNFARVYYSPHNSPTRVVAGDLFFARGRPLLVVKWQRKDGERVPDVCIELDPAKLQRASSNGTIYRYEGKLGP